MKTQILLYSYLILPRIVHLIVLILLDALAFSGMAKVAVWDLDISQATVLEKMKISNLLVE